MGNSIRSLLVLGLLGGWSAEAELITSATAVAFGIGGLQHTCDTGSLNQALSVCSASAGDNATASAQASVSFGTVSAFVEGGAYWPGNGASASASATFSDMLTFYGGTGTGTVTIWESVLTYGTGSLDFGSVDPQPTSTKITETFTFGTPFLVTLSAVASGSFNGGLGDGGSLLVQKSIDSISISGHGITYSDSARQVYNTSGAAGVTGAPEPGTWLLALIGLGMVALAKVKFSSHHSHDGAHKHK